MGDERTDARERWIILIWNRVLTCWQVQAQWNADSEETAKRNTKQLQLERGVGNVRLLHTSDSQI